MLTPALQNCRFLKAARRETTDTTPIWIMRQAGRYLPEYMSVRTKVTFIELCKSPELAAEVTLTAQRVLGVDAAILFADLLPMLEPMGIDLEYAKGEGPVIHNPIQSPADVDRIRELEEVASLHFVFEAVRRIRRDLPADIPLLGFAGAPFTLASYAIEGGGSKNYVKTKTMMYTDEGAWRTLMERLSRSLVRYINGQINAGCQAVQLFDSWAGCLSPDDYKRYVMPYTKSVIDGIRPGTPVINFLTGNPALLPYLREAGGSVIGLDWRVNLADGWKTVGHDVAVQGNLDPVSLMADLPTLRQRAKAVLDAAEGRPGHIFNLGHGVFPEVPPDHVKALVEMVHEMGQHAKV
ncbi:MAG: uroporphyrinogen decarboxylase [Schlesneria sp.]